MACQLDAPFESLESFVQREIATLESLDQTFELGQCFLEIRGFSIAHQATAPAQTHSDIKGGHVTHRRREGSNQLGEFASGQSSQRAVAELAVDVPQAQVYSRYPMLDLV